MRWAWRGLQVLVILVWFGLGSDAVAVRAAVDNYVKYYLVQAGYQGRPEDLSEIAVRFLGDANRSADIFELNRNRVQLDGGKLTDPAQLRTGWTLVLPWDAVGIGVRYGLLPTRPAPVETPVTPSPTASPSIGPSGRPGATDCGQPGTPMAGQMPWAQLRLAPEQAWLQSRGEGVTVAVVASGVDATVPQLGQKVVPGADVVTGSGRGDTDCEGRGTAIAGIIAAQPAQGNQVVGMAPQAKILPIRVGDKPAAVTPAQTAAAIDVAVSAGAKVVTVAGALDLNDPVLARSVTDAVGHDVVVVTAAAGLAAGTETTPSSLPAEISDALLRVGGVGVNGEPVTAYQREGVDVVAPGSDLLVLGVGDTGPTAASGTEYAVAFVAGLAALVRATYPDLTAAQVAKRIEATADLAANPAPDPGLGWGLINPAAAVGGQMPGAEPGVDGEPGGSGPAGDSPADTGARKLVIGILVTVLGLASVLLIGLRLRGWIRAGTPTGPEAEDGDPDAPAESEAESEAQDGEAKPAATGGGGDHPR